MKELKVAVAQLSSNNHKQENLEKIAFYASIARESNAHVMVLPEVCTFRALPREEIDGAETLEGPTIAFIKGLCKNLGIAIVVGSFLEKDKGDKSKVYNTSVFMTEEGDIIARYRKIHLFDVNVPGERPILESKTRKPGDNIVVALWHGIMLGFSVCYDIRFPELYRSLALKGSKVIFVPSSFTMTTGKDHWKVLLRARAIENQVYVVAPNQIGGSDGLINAYGRSMIVDPWGNVLATAMDKETIITTTLDVDFLDDVRRNMPVLKHVKLKSIAS